MTRESDGALAELPEGYKIAETPNGQVSVHQAKSRLIFVEEENMIITCLQECGLKYYRVEVKGKHITIFESSFVIDALGSMTSPFGGFGEAVADQLKSMARKQFGEDALQAYLHEHQQRSRERAERWAHFSPVLRFTLTDKKKRLFKVARMTYRGRGGWHDLDFLPLPKAARKYIKHLGEDSFFDLV